MKPFMMISRRWRLVKTKDHVFLYGKHSNSPYRSSRISCIAIWENLFKDPDSFVRDERDVPQYASALHACVNCARDLYFVLDTKRMLFAC